MMTQSKHIGLFWFIFLNLSLFGQGGFKKKIFFNGSSTNICRNIIESPYGNFLAIGLTVDSTNLFNHLTIASVDSNGELMWHKNYGNSNSEYLNNILSPNGSIFKDNDSFYHTLGMRENNSYIGCFLKFNFSGDTIWQRKFRDMSGSIVPQSVTKSFDDGFLITGYSEDAVSRKCLLIKTDNEGKELWTKKIDKSTPNVNSGNWILQDSLTRKIIIVGYQYIGNSSSWDTYSNILIVDSLGENPIRKTFNNAGGSGFASCIQLKDKNFLTGGAWVQSYSGGYPRTKALLVKFDINGNIIWSKKYDDVALYNQLGWYYELPDGDIMITGKSNLDENNIKPQILKVDKNGNIKWQKHYDNIPNEIEAFYSINPTQDKGFILCSGAPMMSGVKPFSIIKIDSLGCDTLEEWCRSVILDISEQSKIQGYNFEMFPNPANEVININIAASGDKQFVVKVNDVSGKEVEANYLESNSVLKINTDRYESGIYLVSIFYEGRFVESKKLILIR